MNVRAVKSGYTMIPVVFVLTLFLILSALSCMIIIRGSGVYEKLTENMERNYETRVSFSYVATKLRQSDRAGFIIADEIDGVPVLGVKEKYGDEWYVTYVYYYDGWIREIMLDYYGGETIEFDLSDGDGIIKSRSFGFAFEGDRVILSLEKEDGRVQELGVTLRSGIGENAEDRRIYG